MHAERIQKAIEKLQVLDPIHLEVIDESHLHIGHAGAQSGMSHIRIKVSSHQFSGLTRLQQHQKIYQILGTMMTTDFHAVAIEITPPAS